MVRGTDSIHSCGKSRDNRIFLSGEGSTLAGSLILLSNYGIRVGYGDKPSLKLPSLNPVKKSFQSNMLNTPNFGGLESSTGAFFVTLSIYVLTAATLAPVIGACAPSSGRAAKAKSGYDLSAYFPFHLDIDECPFLFYQHSRGLSHSSLFACRPDLWEMPDFPSEANALLVELLKRPPGGKDLLICSPAKGKTSSVGCRLTFCLLLFDLVRLKGDVSSDHKPRSPPSLAPNEQENSIASNFFNWALALEMMSEERMSVEEAVEELCCSARLPKAEATSAKKKDRLGLVPKEIYVERFQSLPKGTYAGFGQQSNPPLCHVKDGFVYP
ncbi:hypothetical protein SLEP1_g59245 [Rubroshorea leprosula]|uniref:Uncharacterized protein n=1 Tax=Rubroshorea leprosula TaxID=152421 RepID=A0AAV5MSV5_9ROSI|nr:hypothetical protein SLEP1_g59245 [Rubroshorea leprosula]